MPRRYEDRPTELARLIRQITNDGSIALFLGIPREEVAAERARMLANEPKQKAITHTDGIDDERATGKTQRAEHSEWAAWSAELRDRTIRAIARHANKQGIHVDTAAYRLLSKGVL